ncbi:sensor histidine kinase [Acuticoccus mangrovi]|uniref:histidine kinase n=1 Tax=Acuticoccus mangrovi TaxID=2796142 RepID=A0A934IIX2_9HYPH|nr:ATP-binding protein [Acuticoccus mangrovi]MBJ3774557.1 HAMP domain-containing protein [Acuticoccus mangrovi]
MPRILRSLTFRLALLYLALFTLSIAGLLALVWWFAVLEPLRLVRESVAAEAVALAAFYDPADPGPLVDRLALRGETPGEHHGLHALVSADGRILAANMTRWPARGNGDWLQFELDEFEMPDGREREVLAYDVGLPDGARLLVGRDIEELDDREELIANAVGWGSAAALLFGLLGGILMSLVVARRIEAVSRTARRVMSGDLSGRVAVRGTGDDFDRLGETLNAMLARIEELVEAVSRVSDQIAHELRTPLTRLHADLEDLAAAADTPERRLLAEQALREAVELQATFDALLRIARIETGRHGNQSERVDLTVLLSDAADLYGPAAEARAQRITCHIETGLVVQGDRNLLFQAVSNLLDNAIKYGPGGGVVELHGRRSGEAVEVGVRDHGAGIPVAERGRVTERFYRVPGGGADGVGLGLSLVAAVAKRHGARLALEDAAPGLRASLRLPAARTGRS